MKNVICGMLVVLCAGGAACKKSAPATSDPSTASSRDARTEQKGDPVKNAIDEDKARELALDEARKRGKDPARYDVTVTETPTEWGVEVVGKEPRPPGDEMMIYVNKSTGQLRVMLGE